MTYIFPVLQPHIRGSCGIQRRVKNMLQKVKKAGIFKHKNPLQWQYCSRIFMLVGCHELKTLEHQVKKELKEHCG
jgi:hypothetical protein